MTEEEARRVELVRAFETEDREGALLTREDREQADARARQSIPAGAIGDRAGDRRFIAARADFAAARLATRHPGIDRLLARSRWPGWISWSVPLAALVAGFIANEFGTGKRLELLAVPLLGTIAWNLLVYLAILATAFRKPKSTQPGFMRWLGIAGPTGFSRGTAIERAANAFRQGWAARTASLNGARLARTLHLAAALFAAGLIGGIYLRALVIEYRAGWESTFLGPEAVHALLSVLLGPASAVTGVAIPPVAEFAAMRWPPVGGGGVNAGPWLHLYATTLAGIVIVPRLVLAAISGARAWRQAANFPVAGTEDFYVRRLLRAAGGRSGSARVTPYAFRPDDSMGRNLEAVLRRALGDGARVRIDPPVDYGSEDEWLAGATLSPEDDYHIVLFNLASTPEAENHGHFAAALAARLRDGQTGTIPAVLLEESAMRSRFAGLSDMDSRLSARAAAWRDVMAPTGIAPITLDLVADGDEEALARRIEAALLPDGAMRG